ncbi:MAG TPA: N,N-dimethylformamidase beta subunit family domain-containing protein [Cyclobacteriaceae bacterium]|nr:N,N-dimethylformamidase beta subunit family domain-containing protein [Cyclobacteriaceae bacterium]
MIKALHRTRLPQVVFAFAVIACQPEENIKIQKPPLPSCNKVFMDGYADRTSYYPGDVANVFIESWSLLECGLGIYDSRGNLAFVSDANLSPQDKSTNEPWKYGFNFSVFSEIKLPSDLASGVYFIEMQIPIVVKSPAPADVTVVFPYNTINAYNPSGGKSLYGFNSTNATGSEIVSFLRPLVDESETGRCNECIKWFPTLADIKMNYVSDLDLDDYNSFGNSKVLVIVGHSEYWTRKARQNFDKFVEGGGHSVLLSGNSMWWQVRYSENRDQLICYRNATNDPEPDQKMKTILWTEPTLDFPIAKSIGADFNGGGYGLQIDNGWDGFKIANPNSPLLEGLNLKRSDIIHVPSVECDGAPIKGFDADGFPVLDNKYNFEKFELIGYDKGTRAGAVTYPTFIVMKATPTSGIIVNMAACDWCSSACVGQPSSGGALKTITKNAIKKLITGSPIFSN